MAIQSSVLPQVSQQNLEVSTGRGLCLLEILSGSECQPVCLRVCNVMVEGVFLHAISSTSSLKIFSGMVEKHVWKNSLVKDHKRK